MNSFDCLSTQFRTKLHGSGCLKRKVYPPFRIHDIRTLKIMEKYLPPFHIKGAPSHIGWLPSLSLLSRVGLFILSPSSSDWRRALGPPNDVGAVLWEPHSFRWQERNSASPELRFFSPTIHHHIHEEEREKLFIFCFARVGFSYQRFNFQSIAIIRWVVGYRSIRKHRVVTILYVHNSISCLR